MSYVYDTSGLNVAMPSTCQLGSSIGFCTVGNAAGAEGEVSVGVACCGAEGVLALRPGGAVGAVGVGVDSGVDGRLLPEKADRDAR